ncbi:MAG TPA: 2-dehydro-3-deoxy-6-phosphogalactonate aldolase [Paenarthrobacter sp.]|nr:2-dehydro-3-deoxy-6-phosphogalactonate aldolase [Paenarthrobacter sp.]
MTTNPATGLVAILRGITPAEAEPVAKALYAAGFRFIEVPLNSPEPFESIRTMRNALPNDCSVGAGTVLTVEDVERAREAGSNIIVSPNTDSQVIEATVAAGMRSYPGVATPSEAFRAIKAGASSLKLFPADAVGIEGMKAWLAVLPSHVELLPVGGVDKSNLGAWADAGARGAGIGSTLYKPGRPAEEVAERAVELVAAWQKASN